MAGRIHPILKGNPWGIAVSRQINGTYVNLEIVKVFLLFISEEDDTRTVLTYIPGETSTNDGEYVLEGSVPKIVFNLPAEKTRLADFLPPGDYIVHARFGEIDGMTGRDAKAGKTVNVSYYEDGKPFP